MAPTTLEIYGSIIYPKDSNSTPDAVTIDITPPTPTAPEPAAAIEHHGSGPDHPLYYLPQSLSSGGLKVHLNAYTRKKINPRKKESGEEIHRHSRVSSIDSDHVLFEVAKSYVGHDFSITSFGNGKHTDGYAHGELKFTAGYFSGGYWNMEFKYKWSGMAKEEALAFKIDEGGKEHGIWKLTSPSQQVIAKDNPQPADATLENLKSIDIEERPNLQGWDDDSWRDFVAACWIAKVWSDCTRDRGRSWLGRSVRSQDEGAAGLRTY